MITATIDDTRKRLVFTADAEGKEDLAGYNAQSYYEAESYVCECVDYDFHFLRPEDIAALTDAPIFCRFDNWTIEDDGTVKVYDDARVFWFPDYAVRDPWEELARDGTVEFIEAESE